MNQVNKYLFLLFLLWIGSFLTLRAQSDLKFEYLSTEDGLTHNTVISIYQDREGFMWFGTEDGLNKFNGYTFQAYKADPNDPKNTLRFNYVYSIYEDSKGRFWIGSHGLHHFNKHSDTFKAYLPDSSIFSYLNIPLSIHEDEQGILWFSAGGGLNRFDPEILEFTSFLSQELTPNFGLEKDINGTFWMGSGAGLYRFDPRTKKLRMVPLANEDNPYPVIKALRIDSENILWIGTGGAGIFRLDTKDTSSHAIAYNPKQQVNSSISNNGIMEDRKGFIWLATNSGLQKIDKKNNEVNTYRANPSTPGSLSSNEVTSVFEDRAGTLWVGTDNGINKLVTYPKPFHTYKIINDGHNTKLEENKINSILTDSEGKVWIGTIKGLYQLNPLDNQIIHLSLSPHNTVGFMNSGKAIKNPSINAIKEDSAGGLWLGTTSGLYHLTRSTQKLTRYPCKIQINFMALDTSGNLWIPGVDDKSGNAVMAVFDTRLLKFHYTDYSVNDPSGLKDGYMKGIIASRSGDLWVAAGMWGIGFRDQISGKFTHYLPSPESPESIIKNFVTCLYEDKRGFIWAGTNMGGIYRLDVKTGLFTNFNTHDGLPSNAIASITADEKGNLWIATNRGLSCFNPEKQNFRNFDKSDGLPDNEFKLASVFSKNGKLYFGSNNGLVVFDPDSIHDTVFDPPVHITGFKVLEMKRILQADKIELPYNENFFSFEFAALDYVSPEKINYAHKLENFNADWVHSGNRRYAAYTNLDPGEYVFRVKASSIDGVWKEGASIPIVIHPPWWKTKGAYILYTLVGIVLLLGFRHFTMNRERMRANLKIKEMEAEHLHELEKTRSRFFANISHEFRTPLTLILGPLENLLHSSGPPDNHSLYLMMERNARRLLQLINQLLDLSKIEAGKLTLEEKPGNIQALIQPLAASFSSLAESRTIQFQTFLEQTDQILFFDSDKIEKIVVNLLSNAFKFTPDGGEVALLVNIKENNPVKSNVKNLEIVVTDSGIGIAKKDNDKIFDHFYQVGSLEGQEGKGTGIGLALVRELVVLHNGAIMIESEIGKGSKFTVCLPLKAIKITSPQSSSFPAHFQGKAFTIPGENGHHDLPIINGNESVSTKEDIGPGEKPLLLIVEDNMELSGFIASHFQSDFQVMEVSNGKLGFQEALNTIPDIIISDVMMPEMDGMELCQKLKTAECTSHIPIILLTAKAGEASKLEGLETGADDYLTKPFSGAELKTRVKNLVEGRKRLRKSFSREVILRPADVAITSADETFLERVMAILEANYMDPGFNIDFFEKEAGFSRTQFYRKMKALTNQAPGEFLRNFRLQKAGMLLIGGQGNITDVAYGVGFNSLSYFTKCFKELYKKSPSEFQGTPTSKSFPI